MMTRFIYTTGQHARLRCKSICFENRRRMMSILTKEERANHRSRSEAATCSQWEIRCLARGDDFCPYTELIRALDTIDALEAERDQRSPNQWIADAINNPWPL